MIIRKGRKTQFRIGYICLLRVGLFFYRKENIFPEPAGEEEKPRRMNSCEHAKKKSKCSDTFMQHAICKRKAKKQKHRSFFVHFVKLPSAH